jgi:type VI secretion system ImpJ/VasE family protein
VARSDQVHWHEGLFLQPHHLQSLQRFVLDQSSAVRAATTPYPYGLISYELSTDALKNLRVQFEHLHLVLRSGLELIYPGNAEMDPLEIGASFGGATDGLTIELSVPSWQPEGANVVAPDSTNGWGSRYRIRDVEQFDENTGTNPQPVTMRRINAWLTSAIEERQGIETIPVLRIVAAAEDGMPRVDSNYIPPCLTIGGSPVLRRIAADISDHLQAKRKEMIPKVTHAGFNISAPSASQIGDVLWLGILGRYGTTLPALARANAVTPFQLYLAMAELLGDLAALNPDQPEMFEVVPYDHDNLGLCFFELAERIRLLVGGKKQVQPLVLTFKPDGQLLTAEMNEQHFTRPDRYYLAIKNGGNADDVANLVKDKNIFKLMSKTEALGVAAIWGVRLEPVWSTPDGLANGPVYFRLMMEDQASKDRWAKIQLPQNRNMIAIKYPQARLSPEATVQLVMPLPVGAKP